MPTQIRLRKGEDERLRAGHLWIFSNELQGAAKEIPPGEVVDLADAHGAFLGRGFYNPHSLIAFRLLTREQRDIDENFWKERITAAYEFRRRVYPSLDSCRVVFGESDLLPGLIIDKYGKYCAVQMLSYGLEKNRDAIIAAINGILHPEGILARNDSGLRKLEGLDEKIEVLSGTVPDETIIEENGLSFTVALKSGQKTGFFFDQRENREAFASFCPGKKVLDGFCHSGAFGIYAARAGAAAVTWIDSSGPALKLAESNVRRNALPVSFDGIEADVVEYLEGITADKGKFDIINVDPPAFVKSRKHLPAGYRLYRKLNAAALALLKPGGILATSSCSHHLSRQDFRKMLAEAAGKAGKQVRILEERSQARDHPVLLSMPETEYLKFAVLQIL